MNETTQQAIVQTLREKILAGELSPGQRLVEAQLAQWLGVSRTPLRYALSVLSSEGLLDRSGARGYVVRRFSVHDILNAIDVRGVLEGRRALRRDQRTLSRADCRRVAKHGGQGRVESERENPVRVAVHDRIRRIRTRAAVSDADVRATPASCDRGCT